ncbi:MAG: hypothetical protein ACJ77N_03465 [Chloroflexota bacterium]
MRLIEDGVLDAELAALVWLLLEARLPLVVAGPERALGRRSLAAALLDFLPPDARTIELAGAVENFEWLPEAPELGWRHSRPRPITHVEPPADPRVAVLLATDLAGEGPRAVGSDEARIALRAVSIGYGMAATITADGLEGVFERLSTPPVRLGHDELSRLGVVLVLRRVTRDGGRTPAPRIVAAHYVRPVTRDAQGHVQRMPPAVLAAYEPRRDELEHFAWGVMAELAARIGRRRADLEREHDARRAYLAGLADAAIDGIEEVRSAIRGYRAVGEAV